MTELETEIEWIINNWDNIDNKFKTYLKPDEYSKDISNLSLDEHIVILILDRQKPSVIRSCDFDEERIGITKFGKVIWGFDSGCSCPSPWDDSYPSCYNVSKTWKEFEINLKDFDEKVIEQCLITINQIKESVK